MGWATDPLLDFINKLKTAHAHQMVELDVANVAIEWEAEYVCSLAETFLESNSLADRRAIAAEMRATIQAMRDGRIDIVH